MKLKTEYRGYSITYDDYEKLSVYLGDELCRRTFPSVEDCRKYIDTKLKKEWEPLPVFVVSYGVILEVTVTSPDEDRDAVWIKNAEGKRSKEPSSLVFPKTERNSLLIADLIQGQAKIRALKDQENKLKTQLVPIIITDIKEKTK